MPCDKIIEGYLLARVHAPICGSHRGSVLWITCINEMLQERSHVELLILRHLRDFLRYLSNRHDMIMRRVPTNGKCGAGLLLRGTLLQHRQPLLCRHFL